MMKSVEILVGSPRIKGNTFQMAEMLSRGIRNDDCICDIWPLYDLHIEPCVDCRGCKKGEMECVIRDNMRDIYPCLEIADIIIFGTPIYWYGPSATMKLMIDRFRPYYANKKLAGKSLALLLPAGTGAADCDLTIEMFKRFARALDMKFIGAVTAKAYDVGDVNNDQEVKRSISDLAAYINGAA